MQSQEVYRVVECLSRQRIAGYGADRAKAIALYKWNIALSESMYPLLHTVEVALRNRLHQEISKLLKSENWLLNRNGQIMTRLHDHWVNKLEADIRDLRKENKLDEGHLIAEMPFGFWTVLLGKQFEHRQFLWPSLKNKVFPYAHGIKIHEIRKQFKKIREIRNRVFHYEAIWHWRDLQKQHDLIVQAINWIEPALENLVAKDRFAEVYIGDPRTYESDR